jgi:hypothetical protein
VIGKQRISRKLKLVCADGSVGMDHNHIAAAALVVGFAVIV